MSAVSCVLNPSASSIQGRVGHRIVGGVAECDAVGELRLDRVASTLAQGPGLSGGGGRPARHVRGPGPGRDDVGRRVRPQPHIS